MCIRDRRERVEDRMRTNAGNFKLNEHQVTQIGFNVYGLSTTEWATIYNVASSTILKAKERFLRTSY